ncbi:hypothetical protein, partial [Paraburkholderia hospita]|uniref:hypothetical protein n=1 Tax=Paraburkholderia hospita TaxID=169430 RepID=UPI001EE6688C
TMMPNSASARTALRPMGERLMNFLNMIASFAEPCFKRTAQLISGLTRRERHCDEKPEARGARPVGLREYVEEIHCFTPLGLDSGIASHCWSR